MFNKPLALLLTATFSVNAETMTATGHTKFDGVYRIYGGGLVDSVAPTREDTKIMMSVDGPLARKMFNAMGPDVKDGCSQDTGQRFRQKDKEKLVCSRSKAGEYRCNFGFDLRTGKSIGGIAC